MPETISENKLAQHMGVSRTRIRNLRDQIDPDLIIGTPEQPGKPILFNWDEILMRMRRLGELYARTPVKQRKALPSPFAMLLPPSEWSRFFIPPMTAAQLAEIPAPEVVEEPEPVPPIPGDYPEVMI